MAGNLQGQYGRREVTPGFNGNNGVAAYAYCVGQLQLGDVQDGPFYADCVFIEPVPFWIDKEVRGRSDSTGLRPLWAI